MSLSWPIFRSQCKTGLSTLGRSLFFSRERTRSRLRETSRKLEETSRKLRQARITQKTLEAENQALREECRQLRQKLSQQPNASRVELPPDQPKPGQQFGPRMIELSINLAREIGMRSTVRVMKIVFDWLKLKIRLPAKDTIRVWLQRLGVARMKKTGPLKDAVWLVDESVQIGKEKVLGVLAVERERFETIGRPLAQKDLHVLAVRPATSWTAEEVAKVYTELSTTHNPPRAIVTDGAKNLREPISTMKNRGKTTLALRDFKHLLANALEAKVGRSPAFAQYSQRIHQTISAVQQTELAHFAPPSFNRRSRFMNLKKHIQWFRMILWQWKHPTSAARQNITPARMKDKLGWVAGFESAVQQWEACQNVISACLKFANARGVYRGAAKDLLTQAAPLATCSKSKSILDTAVDYLKKCEKSLGKHERLPISTEVLESSFASFKHLERHHSRGGFTTLLPVYATLLKPTTAKEVASAFKSVRIKDVRAWLATHVHGTVTSRKQEAFREARSNQTTELAPSG